MFFFCINLDRKVCFMKDIIKYSETCVFPNNIAEVTSISLECNYECDEERITGNFLIEGTYRAFELSINQDNFSYKLPFEYPFNQKVDEESALVNINDFTYDIDNKELKLDIEYEVTADIIEEPEEEFVDESEFERFIMENDVDVIDLSENSLEEENVSEEETPIIEDDIIQEIIYNDEDVIESQPEEEVRDINIEENIVTEVSGESEDAISNTIINNIRTKEDEYITYHIYVCTDSDTLESISNKYKISVDILKNYNDIDTISAGVKLIIPGSNE